MTILHQEPVTFNSLRELRNFKFGTVEIQKAGGYFKARYAGRADCTFGISPQAAEAKLRSGRLGKGQKKCYSKYNDF